jgi:hypothetical protein
VTRSRRSEGESIRPLGRQEHMRIWAIMVVLALAACGSSEKRVASGAGSGGDNGASETLPPSPGPPPDPAPPPDPGPPPDPESVDHRGRPVPPNDPNAAPASNIAGCLADSAHCCEGNGSIRWVHCDPLDNGPTREANGSCGQCLLRCLPEDTRVDAPGGRLLVSTLRVGDVVWTVDERGARVAAPVIAVRALAVRAAHAIVIAELEDGREVRASAGHPLPDGRTLGELAPAGGVIAIRSEPYLGTHTWDLLPEGATGIYFVDGVALASTLSH